MNLEEAKKLTGGLSKPSKMPGFGYSLPASACKVGGKLVKIPGTVCYKCYARKGRYLFRHVKDKMNQRLLSITQPEWVEAMSMLIDDGVDYFRWHDSGDLQSVEHLKSIIEVCKRTPNTKHWLPTKEYDTVKTYLFGGNILPENLCIRLSAPKIDTVMKSSLPTSSVSSDLTKVTCPAPTQGNVCGSCRLCWDKGVKNVCYKKH